MKSRSNKLALLIDGASLHAASRTLGFDIDYKLLLKEFQRRTAMWPSSGNDCNKRTTSPVNATPVPNDGEPAASCTG
jgi:hypothetical protein